jgi:hypothetical protein
MNNSYLVYKDILARCTSIFEASSGPIQVMGLYGLLISGRKGSHKVQEDDAIRRLLCGYNPTTRGLLVGVVGSISTNKYLYHNLYRRVCSLIEYPPLISGKTSI